ncbi:MAG: Ig-like domain-containing protein, partial [Terriglobia bacterium]
IMNESSFSFLPGDTMDCTCQAQFKNCNGGLSYINETDSPNCAWSSSNTAVATMDQTVKGEVHAVADGTATITASFMAPVSYVKDRSDCIGHPGEHQGSETANTQTPAYVSVVDSPISPFQCPGTKFQTAELEVAYQLLDTTKSPVKVAGLSVSEHLSWSSTICTTSDQCASEPTPATWQTDANRNFTLPDTIRNCSPTCDKGGNCSEDWQQKFSTGVTSLGIINGGTAGTLNCITTSCTSDPQGTTH